MNKLFDPFNLYSITLRELADTVNSSQVRIQLPSFQRDAAWEE